jgi:hypothetical protein
MTEEKKVVPKTAAEPMAKKKLNNMSLGELRQLKEHLEVQRQAGSVRYKQVMKRIDYLAPLIVMKARSIPGKVVIH